jgi:hypothetical protein
MGYRVSKPTVRHQSHIELKNDFEMVWDSIDQVIEVVLRTRDKHDFIAYARYCKGGKHRGEPVIIIKSMNDYIHAYIYPCCWRYVSNCHRTWIGGYSEALDKWVRGLKI